MRQSGRDGTHQVVQGQVEELQILTHGDINGEGTVDVVVVERKRRERRESAKQGWERAFESQVGEDD